MPNREFVIGADQWSRFVDCIMSTLAELVTTGLLNAVADDVELVGGNRRVDVRALLDGVSFTTEVKTAWWHDGEVHSVVGHSPVRATQNPDLVALVGQFDTRLPTPTLKRLNPDSFVINADRMCFLVPCWVMKQHSEIDGKALGRALISAEVLEPYRVDLETGVTREQLVHLLAKNR